MKRKLTINLLCALLLLVLISSTTVTLAAWAVRSDTINTVSIGNVRAVIEETYTQEQTVVPEVMVDKTVRVTNTGDEDCLVRVQIEPVWLDGYGTFGVPIYSETLPADNIIPVINTENWYEADGYYYYKGILKPGETTEPLMEQFYLAATTGNEYQGKEAHIIVRMECIQAGETELGLWGLDFETLGVVYERIQPVDQVTRVILKGQAGFSFPDNGGDLFSNFKSLVPGESRTQRIAISNEWTGNRVAISFYAEIADQPQATPETGELIEKLLKEQVHIVVSDENRIVLYEGPVWGNLDVVSQNGTMRYAIPLGNFSTGDSKTLTVHLAASSEMGNEYADLLGHVKWVFQVQGDEGDGGGTGTEVPGLPNTGDPWLMVGVAVTGVTFAALLVCLKLRKKQQA